MAAVLALLVAWIVTHGGGSGDNGAGGSNGKNPASTITPGPSGSGPAISQHPGGRDESSGGASGGDDGSGGSGTPGAGDAGGSDGSGAANGGDSTSGSDGDATGSGGAVTTLPAGTTLPNCTASNVKLSLHSVHNSYGPGQRPSFRLTAKSSADSDCKIDLGPKSAVLTITKAGGSDDYWSSADCPKGASSLLYRVPAGSGITFTVTWDRKPSAAQCATPPAGSAGAGTYLVEAKAPGYAKLRTSFVLTDD
ncbi:hypothetical protein WN71_028900 [Streptomyces mangrovisoli]|uniref:Uncharacterized protein n=1 Tax=Streptomyces mangrovisoli TaxID=1428628 RepID=A0A1J4NTI2_9ACTN|nr:hypothetical protein WN71_028900 [Streptomyces mangrovisoli]